MHKLYWRDWRPVVAREHDEDKSSVCLPNQALAVKTEDGKPENCNEIGLSKALYIQSGIPHR
jgi:hypothetical protein